MVFSKCWSVTNELNHKQIFAEEHKKLRVFSQKGFCEAFLVLGAVTFKSIFEYSSHMGGCTC